MKDKLNVSTEGYLVRISTTDGTKPLTITVGESGLFDVVVDGTHKAYHDTSRKEIRQFAKALLAITKKETPA